jgi:hypothetical protein
VHLHEFPARVETVTGLWENYRVLVEPGEPGLWRATLYTRDAHQKGHLPRVSRVVALGNRQWLVIGETDAWRVSRLTGCGCSSSTGMTAPEVVTWLREVVAAERWEVPA